MFKVKNKNNGNKLVEALTVRVKHYFQKGRIKNRVTVLDGLHAKVENSQYDAVLSIILDEKRLCEEVKSSSVTQSAQLEKRKQNEGFVKSSDVNFNNGDGMLYFL